MAGKGTARRSQRSDAARNPRFGVEQRRQQSEPLPVIDRPLLSNEVRDVPLSSIRLGDDTFQFRVDPRSVQLKRSIEQEGQQFPVVLKGKTPYQLVCGFRRVAALKELGSSSVKAIVLPHLSEDQAYRLSILENLERSSLSELDLANAVAKLKARGKRQGEIARFLGRSVRQIQRYLEVAIFPAELKRAISSRKITMGHCLILNRTLVDGSKIDLKHWLEKIEEKKLSVPALRRHLAEALGRHKRIQYFRKRGKGFRIAAFQYDPSKTTPREKRDMLAALKRASALLRKAK